MEDIKKETENVENQEVEIKVEVVKPEDIKKEETVEKEEVKKEEVKEDVKEDKKEEVDTKYAEMAEKLRVLEESNKAQSEQLNAEKIKSTIMEKVSDKELQKTIMETGLVKSIEDIDMVMKIVEMSKTLNKSKFTDGYKPTDEVQADAYSQAEKKGDILSMIKHKMSKK